MQLLQSHDIQNDLSRKWNWLKLNELNVYMCASMLSATDDDADDDGGGDAVAAVDFDNLVLDLVVASAIAIVLPLDCY